MGVTKMAKVKKGDRVRVTLEGEVYHRSDDVLYIESDAGNYAFYADTARSFKLKVKVLEPAPEVFQAGDIVEGNATGFRFQLLPGDRYLTRVGEIHEHNGSGFRSDHYTKVGHVNEFLTV